jgi:hypothetical protein
MTGRDKSPSAQKSLEFSLLSFFLAGLLRGEQIMLLRLGS